MLIFSFKDSYIKNILQLVKGTVLAQIALIAISPLLTRIYSPEALGTYTVLITIIGLFSPVINGRYEVPIVSAKESEDIKPLIAGSLILSFLFSSVLYIGILIVNELSPNMFIGFKSWLFLIPLILILSGFINVLTSFNNRLEDYRLISNVTIQRGFVQASLQVILGLLKLGILGLILANVVALLVGVLKQYNKINLRIKDLFLIKAREIKGSLSKYKNQLVFSTPAILINSLSYSIIIFLVNYLYGVIEVGYYSISVRMLGLPLVLISANISKVFFEKAVKEKREKGDFYNIFIKTSLLLFITSCGFFSLLMIFSIDVFEFVFGEGWGRAGLFVVIMSPMFGIRLVVSALTIALVIVNKQKIELILQLGFLISALIVTAISSINNISIELFLSLISIFYSINYLSVYFILLKYSKKK